MDNKFLYPVTEATFRKYAESIFTPIRRGECVTTVWVPMAGRRMWNKFLIENISLFSRELPNYEKYLLTYIEPLDLTEESISGYLRLMAKSFIEVSKKNKGASKELKKTNIQIFEDQSASYSSLLDGLRSLLKDVTTKGIHVVFFVGEFDELGFANKIFYNNLKSIWSGLFPRLHYVFLMRERVTRQQNISQWGELNEAVLQNIVHVPLRSEADMNYLIDFYSREYGVNLNTGCRDLVREIAGGHPYLLKAAIRFISNQEEKCDDTQKLKEMLLGHYELISVAKGIYDVRSEGEKEVLKLLADGRLKDVKYKEALDFLVKLGLVLPDGKGDYRLFSRLFEEAVVGKEGTKVVEPVKDEGELVINEQTGSITLGARGIEHLFTRQEYSILSAFLREKDKLFTRDEVGGVLWGKQSYEKFSDWAIDQLMSKLRKKLKNLGTKSGIATVRGRGYKITSI